MTSIPKVKIGVILCVLWSFTPTAFAVALDMREGVTEMSQRIQALHHLSLTVPEGGRGRRK